MFDLLGVRPRHRNAREDHVAPDYQLPSPRFTSESRPLSPRASTGLPPSVARVATRTRLSAELLAAILAVDGRPRATLDDMERADALADALLARRRRRVGGGHPGLTQT
jgi:hypothetical protein